METKRIDFPRFYFLSDEELLEILSHSKSPKNINPYLNKCFEGIACVVFNGNDIVTMISYEDEEVNFVKPVNVVSKQYEGNVEKWLFELEKVMKSTMMNLGKQSMGDV